jgi:hypothetical protein
MQANPAAKRAAKNLIHFSFTFGTIHRRVQNYQNDLQTAPILWIIRPLNSADSAADYPNPGKIAGCNRRAGLTSTRGDRFWGRTLA